MSERAVGVRGRRRSARARQEAVGGYLCISPWIIGFVVFTLGPLIASLAISTMEWPGFGPMSFVGLGNWRDVLRSRDTYQSLAATVRYTFMAVPLGIVVALAIALVLNQEVIGKNFLRALYFMPSIVSGVATAFVWIMMFGTDFGIFNGLLVRLGLPRIPWLGNPGWALRAFVLMSLWGVGSTMIIYLAGLKAIPAQLYEAARIDGAGAVQAFLHVTLPMLSPTLFFSLTTGVIGALQVFTSSDLLTSGGPAKATYFVVLYIFMSAFQYWKMGYACALAWMLFGIIIVITGIQFWLAKYWVYYEAAAPEGKGQ